MSLYSCSHQSIEYEDDFSGYDCKSAIYMNCIAILKFTILSISFITTSNVVFFLFHSFMDLKNSTLNSIAFILFYKILLKSY